MPLEGITFAASAAELRPALTGSLIQEIYQPDPQLLTLGLWAGKRQHLLIALSAQARIQLTEQSFENPREPPPFCMLLRKHLMGGALTTIEQPSLERVIDLVIEHKSSIYKLCCELMGRRSNVILLQGDRVLGALTHGSAPRRFFIGQPYPPLPQQEKLLPLEAGRERIIEALQSEPERTVQKGLLNVLAGVGPQYSRELAALAALDPEQSIGSLNAETYERLWQVIEALYQRVARSDYQPQLYMKDGEPYDCAPFPMQGYSELETRPMNNLSEAFDLCYGGQRQEPFEAARLELTKLLKERRKKATEALSHVEQDLAQADRFAEYKEQGDLLAANLTLVEPNASAVEVEDFFRGGRRVIPLDPQLDGAANAQRLYERYKKLKRGVEALRQRRSEIQSKLAYLQTAERRLEQAETLDVLHILQAEIENELYTPSQEGESVAAGPSGPRVYTIDGYRLLIGRNGRQNDALIRQAARTDFWLHAKDRPGAHVIIQNPTRREIPERVLLRAAQLAAYYSKGQGSAKVPVTYTQIKYLRKPKGAKQGAVLLTRLLGTLLVAPLPPPDEL
jgi:predicted ribosome quality control (RQC) complex YloA/Tae2 family protein